MKCCKNINAKIHSFILFATIFIVDQNVYGIYMYLYVSDINFDINYV